MRATPILLTLARLGDRLLILGGALSLFWASASIAGEREVNVLVLPDLSSGDQSGNWTLTPQGLEVKVTKRTTHLETPYEPQSYEYELDAEFSLTAERTKYITLRLPTAHGYVPLFLQAHPGNQFMGHHMGGYDGLYMRGGAATELLKLGLAKESTMQFVRDHLYKLKVEMGESFMNVSLDGESIISWQGDLSRWKPNPSLPTFTPGKLVIGADTGGILFSLITSKEKDPSPPIDTALLLKTETLGGVGYRLPEAGLKKLLGEPDKWGEEGTDVHDGGTLIEADYTSKGMTISLRTDPKSGLRAVDSVYVAAPSTQRTAGGIQIGSTVEDLRRVYAAFENKSLSDDSFFAAGSGHEGLYFHLKDGRVEIIMLGVGYE